MKTPEHIVKLLLLHLWGQLSEEDNNQLNAWRKLSAENEAIFQKETDRERFRRDLKLTRDRKERIFKRIQELYPFQEQPRVKGISRVSYMLRIAAAIILIIGVSMYWFSNVRSNAIEPGKSQARFGTDKPISAWDEFWQGFSEGYANTPTRKNKYGEDALMATDDPNASRQRMFTLFAPRGGEFCLQLPDSTLIWLNAESSIRYPAHFAGDSTEIFIKGEAYFEVSPNRKVPLLIKAGGLRLEAVAARLNVQAYPGEPVKVNLLDGQLRLLGDTIYGQKPVPLIIEPKDELTLDHNKLHVQRDVDGYPSIAWKKGQTYFKQVPIQTIMTAISRWYDVDVKYDGQMTDQLFDLMADRNSSFQAVLDKLSLQGVRFEIQKRVVIVRLK